LDSARIGLVVLTLFGVAGAFIAVDKLGIIGEGETVHISRACMGGKQRGGVWRAVSAAESGVVPGDRVVVVVPGHIEHLEGRVLATGGDTVTVNRDQVIRNGVLTERTVTPHSHGVYPSWRERTGQVQHVVSYDSNNPLKSENIQVPHGSVFVMGDHRHPGSKCHEGLGLVAVDRVVGLSPWSP
jgi:hypothetical protein